MKRKGKDFVIKNRNYESCIILADAGFRPLYCSQAMENYADYIKVEGNVYYGITKDQILPGDKVVSVEDFLGMFEGLDWWQALLWGFGAGLASNGFFDTGLIEWLFGLFTKKKK
jgi:hypothetical protein